MTVCPQRFDYHFGEILVREQPHHSGRNRIGLIFVRQIAGIGEAGENVIARKARVTCQDLILGLPSGEKIENKLDRQTSPANHRLARQDLRIDDNALR